MAFEDKNSFIIHCENKEQFNYLSDEQAGKIIKAMIEFSISGTVPDFGDQALQITFSFLKARIVSDTEKYMETCRKNSENGKKGGAPKGNRNASKTTETTERLKKQPETTENNRTVEKTTETSLCECDSDSECDSDFDTVCDVCSDVDVKNTTHTTHTEKAEMSISDVLELSTKLGYSWSEKEAQEFLAYNLDKNRTSGWGYAVRKWEENRESHEKRKSNRQRRKGKQQDMTAQEIEEMNAYLSVANRFMEDDEND